MLTPLKLESASTSTISSTILDRKIDETTAGLSAAYNNKLHSLSKENTSTIIDYIAAIKIEVNPSDHYRRDLIELLCKFSKYNDNDNKPFKLLTRSDIIAFLETFRKTETQDPLHKWIGTYNIYRMHLMRFFKWLYSPHIEPDKRSKPAVINNIPQLKRKETSIYKPSDLWTHNDDLLFLKYCPSKREKCYHTMSRDLSSRATRNSQTKDKGYCIQNYGSSPVRRSGS